MANGMQRHQERENYAAALPRKSEWPCTCMPWRHSVALKRPLMWLGDSQAKGLILSSVGQQRHVKNLSIVPLRCMAISMLLYNKSFDRKWQHATTGAVLQQELYGMFCVVWWKYSYACEQKIISLRFRPGALRHFSLPTTAVTTFVTRRASSLCW